MSKKLSEYQKKRDFRKTDEPKGNNKSKKNKKPIFVIQKHDASHLHYDFRIEMEGVLKSWAVPKNLSKNSSVKRLAVLTEDHPMEYASFEGTIPEGEYGAGTVEIWDKGTFDNIREDELSLKESFKEGKIEIDLHGDKIQGPYVIIHYKNNEWLIKKMKKN